MKNMFFSEAIREALRNEMLRDENVFIMGEDVGRFGGSFGATAGLYEEFGSQRVVDTPISEMAIVGLSATAAATGLVAVPELMYDDFMGCAMDQIMNQTAKFRYMYGGRMKVPMTLRMAFGGGGQFAAQHSQCLEAMLVHIPGLKVVIPSCPNDALGLLIASIRDENPVMFLEHQMLYGVKGDVMDEYEPIPLGKGDIKRAGKDVTLVATGLCVTKALEAAKELEKEGIDAEVIDPRTLYPLDKELIYNSVKKTGKLVVVTEEHKRGAWSGELAAMVCEELFDDLKAKIVRVGSLNVPMPFTANLEEYVMPQVKDIVKAVESIAK